eukprot:14273466-Alexandrium_andersonii.AAC.1
MSASLVGSEMCIRDSPWCPDRHLGRSGVRRVQALHRVRSRRGNGLTPLCLLYTSDAADDM